MDLESRECPLPIKALQTRRRRIGGLLGEELTAHGVTQSFAHVLGHAEKGLLAANKIRDGARVIYSHFETTRSARGFQPFVPVAVEVDRTRRAARSGSRRASG